MRNQMWNKSCESKPSGKYERVLVCNVNHGNRQVKAHQVVMAAVVELQPEVYPYWMNLPEYPDVDAQEG